MPSNKFLSVVRVALSLLCALAVTLAAGSALAAGTIKWKTKNLKEKDKTYWLIALEMHMPRAPDVAHVPMKFEFEQTAYYSRDLVEGDKLVERKIPMTNKMPMIESVDVGFLDPGSGKIEKRTKFSFKVNRSQGYEAGEYKVTVTDTRSGNKVGAPATLIFEGENEVIDRRPMVFSGQKKKKEGDEKPSETASTANTQKIDLNDDSGEGGDDKSKQGEKSGGSTAEPGSMNSDGDESLADDDEPQTIEQKPGGCGCRVQGTGQSAGGLALAGLAGALLLLGRRSQPRAS
jgi:MYXO-CTERM domain-containing protein